MNIYSIPNLLVSIYTFALGLVVVRADPRARVNQLCFLLTSISSAWLFSYGIMYLNDDYANALRAAKIGHTAAVILVPTVYWFMLEILGTYKKRLDIYVAVTAIMLAAIATVLTFTSTSYFAGISKHYWGYYPIGGIYMLLYTAWIFIVAMRALFLLIEASRRALKELQSESYLKFNYYAISLAIFIFAAVDYLPKFGLNIYPFGFIFVGAFSSLITYAIIKHQLLNIRIVIRKTLVYTLFATALSLIYVLVIFLIYILLLSSSPDKKNLLGPLSEISFYSITPLIGTIVFFVMGFLVLFSKPKSKEKRIFAILCLETFLWQLVWLVSFYSPKETLTYLAKIAYLGILPLPFTYFYFIVSYMKRQRLERAYLAIFSIIASVLLAFLFSTNLFIAGVRQLPWGNFPYPGPLFIVFTIFAFISMIRGLWLLINEMRSIKNDSASLNKLKYLFIAFILYFFCTFDFLQVYGATWYPVGSFFFLLSCVIITYAILKHDILPIKIAVRKAVVFSCCAVLISTIYLFIVCYAYLSFIANHPTSFFVNSMGIFFIVLSFKPFELLFHRVLERIFFKGTLIQISEQKEKLETELERGERLKSVGILAAGMAHEIRNPLTSIKTFVEYLPKKYDDPEFREKFSRIVVDEVDRVNNIVKQLLEFSKPSELDLKPVLISGLLDQTVNLLNNNLLRQNIQLTKEFDPYATILADKNQLKQAFLNLLLNSIQSMLGGGKLLITARTGVNGQVRVIITDTGCGVSAEQLMHVFDPFYTTKEDGTGLGLAIVHSIITKHGGKIQMESVVGKGTTVNVILKSQS